MKLTKAHAGKWIATKGDEVLAVSKDFKSLRKKMNSRKDASSIVYGLMPKGPIAG